MPLIYRGFTTHSHHTSRTFSVNDIELVKLDLLSHIFTRRGSRLMMPTFGTRIPDMVFEQLDAVTLSIIEDDLRAVFAYDPRVALLALTVTPLFEQNAVHAAVEVLYVELNIVAGMNIAITFES